MSAADITADDIEAVVEVLKSGRLAIGPLTEKFEQRLADYVGTAHAVAVANGTAGLHLCICAAEIGPGDEVITTPFSFVASANCILYERATPIFADIDEQSMNIDPQAVAAALTSRTRAILPVHVFGQPCALDELTAICRRQGLALIEDSCEALGALYHGRMCGSFGNAAVFSFYPNKPMTMGEGGIVTTDDSKWATKLRSLRNQGRNEMGTWLSHERLGFNYRLDEMSAALGYSQLLRIDKLLERRRSVAEIYSSLLGEISGVRLLQPDSTGSRRSWFAYIIRLEDSISRDRVIEYLKDRGVQTRTYFTPIHLQPYFQERFGYRDGKFPVSERVARTILALPFHSNMTEDDVQYVTRCLADAIDASLVRVSAPTDAPFFTRDLVEPGPGE
jgi:perosamine synthetase